MENEIKIYKPDNSIAKGYSSLFREILIEINQNRWLIFQLFRRDFLSLYRQTFLGIFWALILPLVSVGLFMMLNKSRVLDIGDIDTPYPLYALLGISFWQIFSTGLLASANSLTRAESMITKINFSKKSLVIASCGQALVAFLIQIFLVLILFIYYKIVPSTAALFIPLILIPIILLTLGIGLILSLLNSIMRDISNATPVLLTFLLFLTPILYNKPSVGLLANVTVYNPLYYLIEAPREIILNGHIPDLTGFIASCGISIFLFIICLIMFHLSETRITERI